MRKNIRNRLLAITAASAASILLLSGFDSSLTVEDVQNNMQNAYSTMGGVSVQLTGNADVSIDMAAGDQTQSIPLTGAIDCAVELTVDPLVMYVSANMNGDASAMGIAGSMDMEMYLAGQDDGTGIAYMRMPFGEDTGWHAAQVGESEMSQITGIVTSTFSGDTSAAAEGLGIDLAALTEKVNANAQLAPAAVNVNGVDCYEIATSIDGTTLSDILSQVMSAIPSGMDETTLGMLPLLLGGIQIDTVTDCSVDSFAPVYSKIDLAGSDFSMIAMMFSSMMGMGSETEEAPEVNVSVNALAMEMNFSEAPASIEIPAEALAAEVETTLSMPDVEEIAGSIE